MKGKIFTTDDVSKISLLAQIPLKDEEKARIAQGFTKTITVVDQLFSISVASVKPTSQITGLENIFREDVIDRSRIFTNDQALQNALRTHKGFFVVDQILDK